MLPLQEKITFHRHPRATRIKIAIKPDHLRITLPIGATEQQALDFLNQVRHRVQQKQQQIAKRATPIDEHTTLETLTFRVQVQPTTEREKIFFQLKNNILKIEYPHTQNPHTEPMQTAFRKGINFFLQKEARRLLPPRLAQLAAQHGFEYATVKIQSSRTRWGSCSGKRNINLSYHLLTLPPHLIDYVLLHELCHTRQMNHSPRFWQLMDTVTDGKAKALREEIRTKSKE